MSGNIDDIDDIDEDVVGAAAIERTVDAMDRQLLALTFDLAEQGRLAARPNPVVGAVLATRSGEVLATGFHARRGAAHAERALLESLDADVPEDATLYVSLEPCSHHGLTPPCSDAIIERGVRRVVFAASDPNPVTAGRGPARLLRAGVEVRRGPIELEHRAMQQNAGFQSVHLRGRPYVTAKWAMTRTGKFATGDPKRRWISGEHSREHVHILRAASGAVATGIGTVLADDPLLTVRGSAEQAIVQQPLRVVFDRQLRTPLDSQLVRSVGEQAPVLVCCATDADPRREQALVEAGVEVWRCTQELHPGAPCLLGASLAMLARRRVNDVLIEAGPTLLDAFGRASLIDAAFAFVAPVEAAADDVPGLALDHPLVARTLHEAPRPSGDDALHAAMLHPAWAFPGGCCS